MGFMDKAKRVAEQAQRKIDDAQKQRQAQKSGPGAGGVRFDEHGRPIPDETAESQASAGIPTGESMQAEPGTIPSGASGSEGETEHAHDPVEGERPEGVDHPETKQ